MKFWLEGRDNALGLSLSLFLQVTCRCERQDLISSMNDFVAWPSRFPYLLFAESWMFHVGIAYSRYQTLDEARS